MKAINPETIKAAKYSRSNVMTTAWALVKQLGYKLAEALSIAWAREKSRAMKAYSKLTLEEKAVINGNKQVSKSTWKPTLEEQQGVYNFYHNN